MLPPVGRSPYDLKFSIFGIPVRVHPSFWIAALIMGHPANRLDLILIWVVSLFVSILIHELGHALAVRRFGWHVEITMFHFGGLASYSPLFGYTRGRAMWIAFAGPLAGFVFFALVLAGYLVWQKLPANVLMEGIEMRGVDPRVGFAVNTLLMVNLVWGALNLLPILPLDGGKICGELLSARNSSTGQTRTYQIGMTVAAITAGLFGINGQFFPTLFFAGLAIENYRHYEQCRRIPY